MTRITTSQQQFLDFPPRVTSAIRRIVYLVLFVGVPAWVWLCPNWRGFRALDPKIHTNLTLDGQRDLFARDLGRHWIFSPPDAAAGSEVWIDWSSSILLTVEFLVLLALVHFAGAVQQRRSTALQSRARSMGIADGQNRGRAQLLLRLLAKKFGPPTAELVRRVHGATTEELDRWTDRLLSSATLEEVFATEP